MARGATATVEEEQTEMFPELDLTKPEHKAVIKAAKKFHSEKARRDTLLAENKELVDGLQDKLIEAMHAADLTKFRHEGVAVEIVPGKEKAKVEVATEDEEEEDDE